MTLQSLLETNLESLLGDEEDEISSSDLKDKSIKLINVFHSLIVRFDLELFQEGDDLFIATDESGELLYKKVMDQEWMQWKPKITEDETITDLVEFMLDADEEIGGKSWEKAV